MRQQLLVERAPVRPDPHRLAVADGDLDDLAELQVALVLEADVARVDAVFIERLGARRMLGEQLVADIMEVADQRNRYAHRREPVADIGNGRRRLFAIDGQADEFRTGASERGDLPSRRLDVGGVGVGHRLDDDGSAAADFDRGGPIADDGCDGGAARAWTKCRFGGRISVHQDTPRAAL